MKHSLQRKGTKIAESFFCASTAPAKTSTPLSRRPTGSVEVAAPTEGDGVAIRLIESNQQRFESPEWRWRSHFATTLCWQVELEQFFEFLNRQSCIPNNTVHCECVDRIVSRNRNNPAHIIRHHDVLSLPGNPKVSLFQCDGP